MLSLTHHGSARRRGMLVVASCLALAGSCLGCVGCAWAAGPLYDATGTWTPYPPEQAFPNDQTNIVMAGDGTITGSASFQAQAFTLSGNEGATGAMTIDFNQAPSYHSVNTVQLYDRGNCWDGTWTDGSSSGNTMWVRNGSTPILAGSRYVCPGELRATQTIVTCNAGPNPGDPFDCTATVADASTVTPADTPTGTISFSSSAGGFPNGAMCMLSSNVGGSAFCDVTFVAAGTIAAGTQVPVSATYSGDTAFNPSTGSEQVTVASGGSSSTVSTVTSASGTSTSQTAATTTTQSTSVTSSSQTTTTQSQTTDSTSTDGSSAGSEICIPADCSGVTLSFPASFSDSDSSFTVTLGCGGAAAAPARVSGGPSAAAAQAASGQGASCPTQQNRLLKSMVVMIQIPAVAPGGSTSDYSISRRDVKAVEQALTQLHGGSAQSVSSPSAVKQLDQAVKQLAADSPPGSANAQAAMQIDSALSGEFSDASTASSASLRARSAAVTGFDPAAVTAALVASHPTPGDARAFVDAMALATSPQPSPTRGAARLTLMLALLLEQHLTAHLHALALNVSATAHLGAHGKTTVTLHPTTRGQQALRELEILGLSEKVYMTLRITATSARHRVQHATRVIRVI